MIAAQLECFYRTACRIPARGTPPSEAAPRSWSGSAPPAWRSACRAL